MLQTPERIRMLDRMKNDHLDAGLARYFSIPELTAACGRIEENAQFILKLVKKLTELFIARSASSFYETAQRAEGAMRACAARGILD